MLNNRYNNLNIKKDIIKMIILKIKKSKRSSKKSIFWLYNNFELIQDIFIIILKWWNKKIIPDQKHPKYKNTSDLKLLKKQS